MQKYTAADLAAMKKLDLVRIASKLGQQTTVLVKMGPGQRHKRVSAGRDQLTKSILAAQAN